jgi:hypothetical protein
VVGIEGAESTPVREILDTPDLLAEQVGATPGSRVTGDVGQAGRTELVHETVLAKAVVRVVVPGAAARQARVQRRNQWMIPQAVEVRANLRQVWTRPHRVGGQSLILGEGEDDVRELVDFGHLHDDRSWRRGVRDTALRRACWTR